MLGDPEDTGGSLRSEVNVECPSEAGFELNLTTLLGSCEIRVGSHTPAGDSEHASLPDGSVQVDIALTGVAATVVKGTGICLLNGVGERSNSTYVGTSNARGLNGISIDVD